MSNTKLITSLGDSHLSALSANSVKCNTMITRELSFYLSSWLCRHSLKKSLRNTGDQNDY